MLKTPTPPSLYLFSLSLKTAFNRWPTGRPRLKPGQWIEWEETTIALFSEAQTSYKILNFCWHRFPYSWQATQGRSALFVPNTPKYSIPVSLWLGQCCCSRSVAMSCVSLWQARWVSPAKVIALLRCKYRKSHMKNKDFCFLPGIPAPRMIHGLKMKCMSLYYPFTNNYESIDNALPRWKITSEYKEKMTGREGQLDPHIHCW